LISLICLPSQSRMPLKPELVLEDISKDHAGKTVIFFAFHTFGTPNISNGMRRQDKREFVPYQ